MTIINLNRKELRERLHFEDGHGGTDKSAIEKKEVYKTYRENKKKVIELESRNLQYLILYEYSKSEIRVMLKNEQRPRLSRQV